VSHPARRAAARRARRCAARGARAVRGRLGPTTVLDVEVVEGRLLQVGVVREGAQRQRRRAGARLLLRQRALAAERERQNLAPHFSRARWLPMDAVLGERRRGGERAVRCEASGDCGGCAARGVGSDGLEFC